MSLKLKWFLLVLVDGEKAICQGKTYLHMSPGVCHKLFSMKQNYLVTKSIIGISKIDRQVITI